MQRCTGDDKLIFWRSGHGAMVTEDVLVDQWDIPSGIKPGAA